ncbi:hypothetical protein HaLaN_04687 [Haematococcus lacustris]|uniref:Uncharacterized protein n=1 Tax=Haematococcus lacustris TaxID=44745 RepID=A0A699YH82_HAELA|nr:hypothetical protein HaLaN_04687 [Haematococcus lacustris]
MGTPVIDLMRAAELIWESTSNDPDAWMLRCCAEYLIERSVNDPPYTARILDADKHVAASWRRAFNPAKPPKLLRDLVTNDPAFKPADLQCAAVSVRPAGARWLGCPLQHHRPD